MNEIPEGNSWRVSVDGQYRHYKTESGAKRYCKKLAAEGKAPVVSIYFREPTNSGGSK